ncbi:MAG: hypothetical protein ONB32_01240, partial [candidate division KSB1 bacterium]|nr:hypothetical protein [candidate division KSB1 bacterium]
WSLLQKPQLESTISFLRIQESRFKLIFKPIGKMDACRRRHDIFTVFVNFAPKMNEMISCLHFVLARHGYHHSSGNSLIVGESKNSREVAL